MLPSEFPPERRSTGLRRIALRINTASNRSSLSLPSPSERLGADIVVYDGQCRICRGQIARLAHWDTRGDLAYLSLHDPEVHRRWPDLTHEMLMREMWVIEARGTKHAGPEAVRYLCRRLPSLRFAKVLLAIPGMMLAVRAGYRFVARWRYRFGRVDACDGSTCQVHLR